MTENQPRPNLFAHARRELSHDAAIAWLLSWSDPAYRAADTDLHEAGRRLLDSMFQSAGKVLPDPADTVTVETQKDRIDVLVKVGSTHVLAIENKLFAGPHGNQLERNHTFVNRRYAEVPHRAFIYLALGEHGSHGSATANNWLLFGRRNLIDALASAAAQTTNQILQDYYGYLEELDDVFTLSRTAPPERWKDRWEAWAGLFQKLTPRLQATGWGWVNNPSGAFMGLWWGHTGIPGGTICCQLEREKLVVKVCASDKARRSEVRNQWCTRLTSVEAGMGWTRPKHLGHGEWMTVAVRPHYLQLGTDGVLDLDATTDHLREVADEVFALTRGD